MKVINFPIISYLGVLFSLLICSTTALAQDSFIIDSKLRSIQPDTLLPAGLRSSRSVVLIYTPYYENQPVNEWREVGKIAHAALRKSGIDAVAYYNIYEIFSGPDVTQEIAALFKKRQINNLIIVRWAPKDAQVQQRAEIIVTPFKNSDQIIDLGQKAYNYHDSNLESLFTYFYRFASNQGLNFSNYLIIDQPEFFKGSPQIKNRRFETYWADLRIDKLAVPYFSLPDSTQQGPLVDRVKKLTIEQNQQLDSLLKTYPFQYGMEMNQTEEQLKKKGYQYIVLFVSGPGSSVKEMLQYKQDIRETEYISETLIGPNAGIVRMPVGVPVYKFYIKQLYSGNLYLGTVWDASTTWQQALESFIYNLRSNMKVPN